MSISCLCPSFDCSKWPRGYQTGQPVLGGYEKTLCGMVYLRHTVICSRYIFFFLFALSWIICWKNHNYPFLYLPVCLQRALKISDLKKKHNFPPSGTEISLSSSRRCITLYFNPSEVHSCSWYELRTQVPFSNEQPRYRVYSQHHVRTKSWLPSVHSHLTQS